MHGAIAAAVGITTKTCWTIANPYFRGRDGQIRVMLIGAAAFALNVFAHIPPIWVLILAAVVGPFLPEPRP
jgi:chromate transporter